MLKTGKTSNSGWYTVNINSSDLPSSFFPASAIYFGHYIHWIFETTTPWHIPLSNTATRYIKPTKICANVYNWLIVVLLVPLHDGYCLIWYNHNIICMDQDISPILETIWLYGLSHPHICNRKSGFKSNTWHFLCKLPSTWKKFTIHPIQISHNNNGNFLPGSKLRSVSELLLFLT